ncbi:U-box domain-containing protein 9-like [Durio zibethinus]|uniref:RING-type E3 ubiquitin transferase n=1 Tax=Durio zibethinus TaxID=66656 RepID=A0A6P5WSA0_DURZI|nr:U-box domain-containing protein 9-like [Durio zibethinus]XP_022718996.1 U-box domain-containing protein 9-like [Durio zibethinus]
MAEKEELEATGEETELKKELQRVVKTILEDGNGIEITIEAMRIFSCLAELMLKKPLGLGMDDTVLPEKFKCPLSGEIMGDPVVLGSGQTYDRPHIQKWLNEGNLTCPLSKQVLSHSILTPNCLVRELISHWCKKRGIALPKSYQDIDGEMMTEVDRMHLNSLLEKMSSSLSDQKEAAKELRRLTKTTPSYRASFCEFTNAISRLLSPLSETKVESDPDLQEDLITTVLNLSIHDNNKKPVAENPVVIPLLTESLKFGTIETRRNAAAALFTLSALDSNKFIIGNSGALAPLLQLLCEGHPLAMKDAASAIFNLCPVYENKAKFNEIGAAKVILQKIKDGILVNELLSILAMLSTHHKAIDELGDLDTLHCLLQIIRDSSSDSTKENCVAILYNVCLNDLTLLMVVKAEEIEKHTLAELADTGTTRARRKASGIIEKMHKALPTIHTT